MNIISVEVTYPSLPQSPISTPPCTPTPILRPQTFGNNQVTDRKGIVRHYDINELNEELRLFGISEETRTALLRKRNPVSRRASRTITPTTSSLTRDVQDTNRNPSSKSREQPRQLLLHSAAARNCYVDFGTSFRDAVRAQSVKMATKNSAPAMYPHVDQRRPQTPKRKKSMQKGTQTSVSGPVHIREGLLIVANGKVVDFRDDVKRSERLQERQRKKLRKQMRESFSIVRSFDDTLEKFHSTKTEIERTKFEEKNTVHSSGRG